MTTTPRPSRLLKRAFDAPAWLYRHGMGRLLGRRILVLTHVGRKTGTPHQTVLEVAHFDRRTNESVVASAYGRKADWYRNIEANRAERIQTGRLDYRPEQRFLTDDEARETAERFCRDHRLEAKMAIRALASIGAVPLGTFDDPVDLLASLPMVAFRPPDQASISG